jgi:polyisoprenoid-binding protein YceI
VTRLAGVGRAFLPLLLLSTAVLISACAQSSAPAPPESPASPVARANGSPGIPGLPPGVRVEVVTPTPDMSPPPPEALKLVFQPGSQARYRAQELVLGRSYFSDAIGSTDQVEGTIYVRDDGTPVRSSSLITVNLQSLKSDEEKRDEFIKEVTLETDRFPQATFVPLSTEGLPRRVTDDTGPVNFRLSGELTLHGVTKPASWIVSGTVSGNTFTGTASTTISLQDFGMTPPQVPIVLGVDDNVRLELAFTAIRERE